MPSNADKYPYILASVDKSIYEKPFFSNDDRSKLSPKELYVFKKNSYPQIEMWCENFFNNILNIDYRTITEKGLREKIEPYFIFKANDYAISSYVKYVKKNEIIIQGSSQLQFPIIYFDGSSYRPRLRLKFEVKHSKTKENLLYLDMLDGLDGLKDTYKNKSYDILVDYYMSNAIGNNNVYLDENRLYKGIVDKNKCGITQEAIK